MGIKLHGVYSISVPLHLDIGDCINKCKYCFVGSNNKKTSIKQIENSINKKYDGSLLSYYLENRYPICVSNTSDIFNCQEKELYQKEIEILKSAGFPIYYQTKGHHNDADLNWLLKNIRKEDVIYITITSFNDSSLELENKSPSITNKLELIKELENREIMINIGFNPVIEKYINQDEIIEFMSNHKNIDYVIHPLHGIKNVYENSKEINKLTRNNTFKIGKIIDYAIKENISIRSKNIFSVMTKSYGDKLKKHFNKPIINGSDLEIICKEKYENSDKKGFIGVTFDEFYDKYKKDFLDITISKKDVRILDNYSIKRIPESFSYKDYIKFCWENPEEIKSFTGFASVIFFLGRDRTEETLYYYPFEDIFIDRVKESRRYKNDFIERLN